MLINLLNLVCTRCYNTSLFGLPHIQSSADTCGQWFRQDAQCSCEAYGLGEGNLIIPPLLVTPPQCSPKLPVLAILKPRGKLLEEFQTVASRNRSHRDCLAYNKRLLNVEVINEPVCEEPRGRPSGRDRKWTVGERAPASGHGRSGSGRPGPRGVPGVASLGWRAPRSGDPWASRPGAPEPRPAPFYPPRRRRRRAPEAGGDFLCPPRQRPLGRRRRLSLAPRPPAPTKRRAEGRGRRRPGGRHRAPGQDDRGEWGRAGGSRGWREGRLASWGGGWGPGHPWGRGGKSTRPLGSCLSLGSAPLTFGARPSPRLPRSHRRCQPRRLPSLSLAHRLLHGSFLFVCLCPSSWKTCFLTSLPSLQPCLPLSDSLKSDPLRGTVTRRREEATLLQSRSCPRPTRRRGQASLTEHHLPLCPWVTHFDTTVHSLSSSAGCRN